METPFFVIDEKGLENNIRVFRQGMRDHWLFSQLAYSVKTNSLPWVLSFMKDRDILAEVVSDEEYELALRCGYQEDRIVFNGPIKTKECFLKAIQNRAYVNVDSLRELQWLNGIEVTNARIGLRLNIPSGLFRLEDIDYTEDGFRFGFSESSDGFQTAIRLLRKIGVHSEIGLHLHCNSVTRAPDVYRVITGYAVRIIEKYDLNLSFIDIGGGFWGGVPGKTTPDEYFSVIRSELEKSPRTAEIMLIAEPGSALIGSVVDLHTSVLDVKDMLQSRVVTTDGSRILIDPLWKKKRYSYSIETANPIAKTAKQIICGYTCMDHDRLMILTDEQELQVGDKIIYHRVGAYSMTFGGPFIRYYPDVYVQSDEKTVMVRKRFSTDDYYFLQAMR